MQADHILVGLVRAALVGPRLPTWVVYQLDLGTCHWLASGCEQHRQQGVLTRGRQRHRTKHRATSSSSGQPTLHVQPVLFTHPPHLPDAAGSLVNNDTRFFAWKHFARHQFEHQVLGFLELHWKHMVTQVGPG